MALFVSAQNAALWSGLISFQSKRRIDRQIGCNAWNT